MRHGKLKVGIKSINLPPGRLLISVVMGDVIAQAIPLNTAPIP